MSRVGNLRNGTVYGSSLSIYFDAEGKTLF